MTTVLITGATGFIGSNLVPHLAAEGWQVRALVREGTDLSLAGEADVEPVPGDVRDPGVLARAVKGADVVYHVAGVVSYWRRRRDELHDINVTGTRNVVRACLREGVGRLVFTSSVGAIGVPERGVPGTEDTPFSWDPYRYYYCLSKYMGENEVLRGVADGLDGVILNPSLVVGPKDINWNAGRIFAMVARGGSAICTNGAVSVVDVDDVCRAHVAAAHRGTRGARYILSGPGITYRDLFAEIGQVMGKPELRVRVVPDRVALATAHAKTALARLTRREPDLTPELVAMNTRWRVYDCAAARRDLGFTVTPLTDTLQRTYDWYRAAGML